MRVAVIGSGISGLGAAWLLKDRYEVTLFEARGRLGGHTNTVAIEHEGESLGLDTGFLIYNRTTYPRLTRLFEQLGVPDQATDMSFSMQCDACGIEYAGRGLGGVFVQKRNLLRPSFLAMLRDIARFGRLGAGGGHADDDRTLEEFLSDEDFGDAFRDHYIVPMAAALWSSGSESAGRFPVGALFEFFRNHGLLRMKDRLDWRTVPGGSSTYVDSMRPALEGRIRLTSPVTKVTRDGSTVRVSWSGGEQNFDHVVIATHADQALAMLEAPTAHEAALLGAWKYTESDVWLHTDVSLLPSRRRTWSAWNYQVEDCAAETPRPTVTYGLNFLQRLTSSTDFFVTLNPPREPSQETVFARMTYRHPAMTPESTATWAGLPALNVGSRVSFCGSYFGTGFHEDGLASADAVAERLGGSML